MVQAAANSGLDFSAANPRCRRWWTKARWILDRLEDLNTLTLYDMQHRQHVSVLDYNLDKQAFDSHWKSANDILNNVFAINFPWSKDASKNKSQNDRDALLAQWKKKYGDPKDPKVQEYFLKVANAWRAKGEEAKKNMFSGQRKFNEQIKKVVADRNKPKGKK